MVKIALLQMTACGNDRDANLAKREEYFHSAVNLVELDFLRA